MVTSGPDIGAVIGALILKRRAANRRLYLLAGGLIVSGVPLLIGGLRGLRTLQTSGDKGHLALLAPPATLYGVVFLAGFVSLTWKLYRTPKQMRELTGNLGTRTPMVWRKWCSLSIGLKLIAYPSSFSPTYSIELWAGLWPSSTSSEDTLKNCPPTLYFQLAHQVFNGDKTKGSAQVRNRGNP
jgi:formate hydrogenlyase subunit 3/multisubunit Na+/H+ antiporter MnhD subunit